ncbi:MAG: hypothetical protein LDL16_04360 [Thiobacillus sp.]|nr:hypothetical protein [Thiobacillus sp.]
MSMQELNQAEMSEVSGGLSIAIGDNPILNGGFNLTPGGTFNLLGSLLAGALGLLGGLLGGLFR